MNRRRFLIMICIGALVFSGCANTAKERKVDFTKSYLTISCNIDKTSRLEPSLAIWIENPQNGDLETLYHTKKARIRPLVLPVWSGLEARDITSSATPSEPEFTSAFQIPERFVGKNFVIYIEANVSFDYNDYYKENAIPSDVCYSDVNGQPSMVWKGTISTYDVPNLVIIPIVVGHGDILGRNNQISDEMSKITTAYGILREIKIIFYPM